MEYVNACIQCDPAEIAPRCSVSVNEIERVLEGEMLDDTIGHFDTVHSIV